MTFRAFALLAAAIAAPAFAAPIPVQPADQKACTEALSPEARLMYDAAAPHMKADSDIRDVLRTNTRLLVFGGKLTIGTAQANGPAAAKCLALIKRAAGGVVSSAR